MRGIFEDAVADRWRAFRELTAGRCDIFVHTWDEDGMAVVGDEDCLVTRSKVPAGAVRRACVDLLRPKGIVVEDHSEVFDACSLAEPGVRVAHMRIGGSKQDCTAFIGSQLRSWKRAFGLMAPFRRRYRTVVKMRGDVVFAAPEDFARVERCDPGDALYVCSTFRGLHGCELCDERAAAGAPAHSGVHGNRVEDIVFYGSPRAMRAACYDMPDKAKGYLRHYDRCNEIVLRNNTNDIWRRVIDVRDDAVVLGVSGPEALVLRGCVPHEFLRHVPFPIYSDGVLEVRKTIRPLYRGPPLQDVDPRYATPVAVPPEYAGYRRYVVIEPGAFSEELYEYCRRTGAAPVSSAVDPRGCRVTFAGGREVRLGAADAQSVLRGYRSAGYHVVTVTVTGLRDGLRDTKPGFETRDALVCSRDEARYRVPDFLGSPDVPFII